jgi:glycosyltransferase involved in cell wall biosynthesis
MNIGIIDPPLMSLPRNTNWERFPFSDIAWGYCQFLSSCFTRQRQNPTLYLISSYRAQRIFPGVVNINIPTNHWYLRNLITIMLLFRKYSRSISKMNLDIIHSSDYLSLAIIAQSTAAIPVITTPGSILERKETFNPYSWYHTKTLEWAVRVLKEKPTYVLATSEYMAGWWTNMGFPQDRVRTLYLPVIATNSIISQPQAHVELKWDRNKKHLLSVAGLRPEMRIDLLLSLFNKIMLSGATDVHLHIVGTGELEKDTRKLVFDLGISKHVTLHGSISHQFLPMFYGAADALIVSRRFNATPRAAQEALCYGCPVVANNNHSLQGYPEELDSSIYQFAFESEASIPYIQNTLNEISSLDRYRIANTARRHLSAETIASQLASLYSELI